MKLLHAELTVPSTKFDALIEAVAPDQVDTFTDHIDEFFAEFGLVAEFDDDGLSGFDPIESTYEGDQDLFETIAGFSSGDGLVLLGGDDSYVEGTIEDGQPSWESDSPSSAYWWNSAGMKHAKNAKFFAAYCFEQAISHDEKCAYYWHNLLMMFRRLGLVDRALEICDQVIEVCEARKHDNSSRAYEQAGTIKWLGGDFEAADELYEKSMALSPIDGQLSYNWACAYARTGRVEEALEALERAVWVDRDYQDSARDDGDFENLKDHEELQSILEHGFRDYHPGKREEIEERIEKIRDLLHSDDPGQRVEAIELALEYDDRFIYYEMLKGVEILPFGDLKLRGFFSGEETYFDEFVEFATKLPERFPFSIKDHEIFQTHFTHSMGLSEDYQDRLDPEIIAELERLGCEIDTPDEIPDTQFFFIGDKRRALPEAYRQFLEDVTWPNKEFRGTPRSLSYWGLSFFDDIRPFRPCEHGYDYERADVDEYLHVGWMDGGNYLVLLDLEAPRPASPLFVTLDHETIEEPRRMDSMRDVLASLQEVDEESP